MGKHNWKWSGGASATNVKEHVVYDIWTCSQCKQNYFHNKNDPALKLPSDECKGNINEQT